MHSDRIHLFVVNYERAQLVYSARYDKYVDGEKRIAYILFTALRALSLYKFGAERMYAWLGLF